MKNVSIVLTVIFAAFCGGCYSNTVKDGGVNNANVRTAQPTPAPTADTTSVKTLGQYAIPGNSRWINTDIDVPEGCEIAVSAGGKVDVGASFGEHGPDGTTEFADVSGYPVESEKRYGLALQVTTSKTEPTGTNRDAWAYADQQNHVTKQAGRLWLAVNDDAPEDNTGQFFAKIQPCPTASIDRSGAK